MPEEAVPFCWSWADCQQGLKHGFDWSWKPLVIFMRYFGIPLDFQVCLNCWQQPRCWWAVTSLGFLSFFLNAECHFALIGREIYRIHNDPSLAAVRSQYSSAFTWNHYIEITNNIAAVVGVHALFLGSFLINWPHLIQAMNCLEKQQFFKEKDYRRFRFNCLVGVAASIAEIIFWVFVLITSRFNVPEIIYQLIYIGACLFPLYIFFSIILFGCLGWMACSMFNILGSQIEITWEASERKNKQHNRKPDAYWRNRLTVWKVQYYSVGEFVCRINDCFGPLLLLIVVSYIVRMINTSFTFLTFLRGTNVEWTKLHSLYLFILVKDFLTFCTITYIPNLIHKEAIRVIKKLQQIQFENTDLQNQVNFLKLEVSLTLPKITAAGFFSIDCHLIPTFVGTTLTYLIILYQFDSIEHQ